MRSMTPKKLLGLGTGLLTILSIGTSCTTASPVIKDYCQLYHPIYVSRSQDFLSKETQNAIDGNNAVWLKMCNS